jgi:hypothetical protein
MTKFNNTQVDQVSDFLQDFMKENNIDTLTADECADLLTENNILENDIGPKTGFNFRQMLRDGRDGLIDLVEGAYQKRPRTKWTIYRNMNYKCSTNKNRTIITKHETVRYQKIEKNFDRFKIISFIVFFAFVIIIIIQIDNYLHKKAKLLAEIEEFEKQLDYYKYGAEDIYEQIQLSFKNKDYNTCKDLYIEMKTNHFDSKYFDSLNIVYLKVLDIEERINNEYQLQKEKEDAIIRERMKTVYIYAQAQAYSDGVLSCNLYLYDSSEQQYSFEDGFLSFKIYDYRNDLFASDDSIGFSGYTRSIFLDIPIGKYINNTSTIKFEYITINNNYKFKSKKIRIDR